MENTIIKLYNEYITNEFNNKPINDSETVLPLVFSSYEDEETNEIIEFQVSYDIKNQEIFVLVGNNEIHREKEDLQTLGEELDAPSEFVFECFYNYGAEICRNERIIELTQEEFDTQYPNAFEPSDEETTKFKYLNLPKRKIIIKPSKTNNFVTAIDNTTHDAWTEDFPNKYIAEIWLNGEFELSTLMDILKERNQDEDLEFCLDTNYFGFGSFEKLEEAHLNNYK